MSDSEAKAGEEQAKAKKKRRRKKKSAEPGAGAAPESKAKQAPGRGARKGSVKVVFLGGLGEIGRNCAAIEVDGRIIVLDCGIMFPEPDMPGVDLVLPDFSYLVERKDRVDAIVLTHGHEDHTGGLPFLLRELEAPIYGSAFTLGLARHRIDEAGLTHRTSFKTVGDHQTVQIAGIDVEFIPVTHSVPEAMGVAFHTPQGVIYHSGDFKLDLSPVDGRRTDLSRIGELAKTKGIRLLLADSTNAEHEGHTGSESDVGRVLRATMATRPGKRMVVACFASHVHRVQQIIDAAVASGRKVATLGRSMAKNVELAKEMGIIDFPEGTLVDIRRIDDYPDGEVCIVSTGSQGEPMSALTLMASGRSKWLKLGDNDVVIISAHPIPGNEWGVGKVIDGLHRQGAEVVHSEHEHVHVSGHASRGELRTLISVASPDCFIPVHGEYRHMVHHLELARAMGIDEASSMLCEDGSVVELNELGLKALPRIPAPYQFVDGNVDDVEHGVVRDRKVLAEEGMVMVICTVDLHAGQIVAGPTIESKGWVFAAEAEGFEAEATAAVRRAIEESLEGKVIDADLLAREARRALGRYIGRRTRRKPMVVPVIVAT